MRLRSCMWFRAGLEGCVSGRLLQDPSLRAGLWGCRIVAHRQRRGSVDSSSPHFRGGGEGGTDRPKAERRSARRLHGANAAVWDSVCYRQAARRRLEEGEEGAAGALTHLAELEGEIKRETRVAQKRPRAVEQWSRRSRRRVGAAQFGAANSRASSVERSWWGWW